MLSLFYCREAVFSYHVTGRVTLGTYLGTETLSGPVQGDPSNDVYLMAARFYLRATDMTENRFSFTADVRDKYDAFVLVEKQSLALKANNTLQFRELSVKYPGPHFFAKLGRFPVPDAGPVFADGGLAGFHLSEGLSLAGFGGLNPKRPEQMYVQYNANDQIYGTFLSYAPSYSGGGSSFSAGSSAVASVSSGQTDRAYWSVNTAYQWEPRSRINFLGYLDFVPRVHVQSGILNYQQALSDRWTLAVNLFAVDVIEYQRLQGLGLQSIRETVPLSQYREGGAKLRYGVSENWFLETGYATGHRDADTLTRQQVTLASDFLKLFDRHSELVLTAGYRSNFTSEDWFVSGRFNY